MLIGLRRVPWREVIWSKAERERNELIVVVVKFFQLFGFAVFAFSPSHFGFFCVHQNPKRQENASGLSQPVLPFFSGEQSKRITSLVDSLMT